MTNEFKITKTGVHRTKAGTKAVVKEYDLDAYDLHAVFTAGVFTGHFENTDGMVIACDWSRKGKALPRDYAKYDIVSEWKEPEINEWWLGLSPFDTGNGFEEDGFGDLQEALDSCPDSNTFIKFRLTIQPDGKQHLEIVEQVNRGDV